MKLTVPKVEAHAGKYTLIRLVVAILWLIVIIVISQGPYGGKTDRTLAVVLLVLMLGAAALASADVHAAQGVERVTAVVTLAFITLVPVGLLVTVATNTTLGRRTLSPPTMRRLEDRYATDAAFRVGWVVAQLSSSRSS